MPLLFLLFIAFATGAFAAYSGREEVRLSADPVWRMESFLGYALFIAFVLLPATILFYAFHGDWFLFYFVDTSRAPWLIGLLVALAVAGAAAQGIAAQMQNREDARLLFDLFGVPWQTARAMSAPTPEGEHP